MTDSYLINPGDTVNVNVADTPPSVTVTIADLPPDPFDILIVPGAGGGGTNLYIGVLPAADQDGLRTVFDLPEPALLPTQIQLFRNGLREVYGHGFTATTNQITFTTAPLGDDVIALTYPM